MDKEKCLSCEKEISADSNFCSHCGKKQKSVCNCWVKEKPYRGGENMNLRHIKEKIEDKMLDPDFTSKVSLAVSIVSLVVAVLVLYVKLKYRTV